VGLVVEWKWVVRASSVVDGGNSGACVEVSDLVQTKT